MSEDGLLWWGYIHTNKELQVKRFFGYEDIEEAKESSFVEELYGPFEADSKEDAREELKRHFGSLGL